MKHLYKAVYLLFAFVFFSCKDEEGHYRIYLQNNSTNDLLAQKFYSTAEVNLSQALKENVYWSPQKNLSGNEIYFGIDTDPWEGVLNTLLPTDTMMVVVFDAELFATSIPKSCLVAYKLDLESLNRMNWHLYYPPTDEMLDMDMVVYPSGE